MTYKYDGILLPLRKTAKVPNRQSSIHLFIYILQCIEWAKKKTNLNLNKQKIQKERKEEKKNMFKTTHCQKRTKKNKRDSKCSTKYAHFNANLIFTPHTHWFMQTVVIEKTFHVWLSKFGFLGNWGTHEINESISILKL